MPIKINPDLKMNSFRNWHGIHMLQFHNYLEILVQKEYGDDVRFINPDTNEGSQFVSRMHRYLQCLFLIEFADNVSVLNKPGLFGNLSMKNIARMTDMNTNIRSVYGEDFFKEYSYLSDQVQKLNRVNEYIIGLQYYGALERAGTELGELDQLVESLGRLLENIREYNIDSYITEALDQLKVMRA